MIGSSQNEEAWRYFKGIADAGYSVVFFGSPYATETAIRADNRKGGSLAATHLVDQGCRHIAYIGPPMPAQQQFEARFAGFSETLADHGLAPIIARIPEGETKEDLGRAGEMLVDNVIAAISNAPQLTEIVPVNLQIRGSSRS